MNLIEFKCTQCNYITMNKSNYNKHLKSIKHMKRIITPDSSYHEDPTIFKNQTKLIYQCQQCSVIYTRQSSLTNHKRMCTDALIEVQKLENIKQIEIEKLKTELHMKNKQINTLENFIQTIKTSSTYNITIKKLVKTSYSNAPALTQLDNYEVIHDKQFVDFIDEIISYNDQKILYKYIGDIIIKYYKKDKPEDQSLWNTDVSRLNYIIKEVIASNKSRWVDDTNANRIKESIIQPLLQHIKSHIKNEHKLIHNKMRKGSADVCIQLTPKINNLAKIQLEINNGMLEDDIVKYISPSFRHMITD